MNILITRSSGKGGVASFYNSIIPFLNNYNGYKISEIEIGSAYNSKKLLHVFRDQYRVYKIISYNEIDIIHVNPSLDLKSILRDGLIMLIAQNKKIPVLVFMHGWSEDFEKKILKIIQWFFNITILKAKGFIVLASSFKKKLITWGVKSPIYISTTAVEENLLKNFSIEKKIYNLINCIELKLLFLSRLEKEKGVIETIEAFMILRRKGYKITLSVAGDGPMMDKINNLQKNLNNNQFNIMLLGDVRGKEKINLFNSHHIYCFPTYYGEGMPITILEAMAFGMPIITRPVGGIKDFFINGKMGFLTESKRPDEIAKYIEILLCDRKKILNIAKFNHAYAMKNFIASVVSKNIIGIYKNIFEKEQKQKKYFRV